MKGLLLGVCIFLIIFAILYMAANTKDHRPVTVKKQIRLLSEAEREDKSLFGNPMREWDVNNLINPLAPLDPTPKIPGPFGSVFDDDD